METILALVLCPPSTSSSVAQILHLGPYDRVTETIERLHQFITANGYEIAGPHEEEYQSKPDAKVIKTLIRYQVKKKGR